MSQYTVVTALKLETDVVSKIASIIEGLEKLTKHLGQQRNHLQGWSNDFRIVSRAIDCEIKNLGEAFDAISIPQAKIVEGQEKINMAASQGVKITSDKVRALEKEAMLMGRIARDAEKASAAAAAGGVPPGFVPFFSDGRRNNGRGGGSPPHGGGMFGSTGDMLATTLTFAGVGEAFVTAEHSIEKAYALENIKRTIQMSTLAKKPFMGDLDAVIQAALKDPMNAGLTNMTGYQVFRDLNVTAKSPEEALKSLPATLKAVSRIHNASLMGHMKVSEEESENQIFAAIKAGDAGNFYLDNQGGFSEEKFNTWLDTVTKLNVASGGRLQPSELLNFMKNARISAMGLSSVDKNGLQTHAMEYLGESLMVEGGARTGTASAAMFREFQAGTMTKNVFEDLQKAGIISPKATWHGGRANLGKVGEYMAGSAEEQGNPVLWLHEKVREALDKQGIKDPMDQAVAAQKMASRMTGGGLMAQVLAGWGQIENFKRQYDSLSPDSIDAQVKDSPAAKVQSYHTAVDRFETSFGAFLMGPGVGVLEEFTKALNGITDWAKANPGLSKDLIDISLGLIAFAGGVILLSKVFGAVGTLVAGIKTAAAAVGIGTKAGLVGTTAGRVAAIAEPTLGGVAGGVGTLAAIMLIPTNQNPHEENTPGYANRFDATMPTSPTVGAPTSSGPPINITGRAYMDSKDVGPIIFDTMGKSMLRTPNTGPQGPASPLTIFPSGVTPGLN